ncbi:pyridoxamine 5'-phosphate oxidase family protein [Shewanella salipaludis]|uniref:Pyridoxamine 5'-phosphate oxidase family protein n=1 Tax=Shewanella salipaludis TaxID=2723052 RepID=A0A972FPX0_9GAMM|nr:pyridoxamine 5'-phosphate oxidase family protein [Shewanella salipaludis]NMH63948.1 pyridoxamine 5'-phosphate oxidase family protein [Shewanella salipaludis]
MGKQFSELSSKHIAFIEQQKIYFVGTAAETGSVNLSPKGGDSLRVISPTKIAWLNLTGSGNESASHVLKNARMTIMFCAFEGSPLILRVYGQAEVLHSRDADWAQYSRLFPESVAARQVFVLDIAMVQTSCGMAVPYFTYEDDRDDLAKWSEKRGSEGIEKYWLNKNQQSIDGFATEIAERSGITEAAS